MKNRSVSSHGVPTWSARLITTLCLFVLAGSASAQTPTCPAANPNDSNDDAAAINACLTSLSQVVLDGNSAGMYWIEQSINMPSGKTLSSVGNNRPVLKARPNLNSPLIVAENKTGFTIRRVMVHGDYYNRTYRDSACPAGTPRANAYNIRIGGSNYFVVDDVECRAAMCGSALYIDGNDFEVKNSWFVFNGRPAGVAGQEPWSDGITVTWCGNGYIHNNTFWDNTDVDLIVGAGNGCRAQDNTISHTATFGYAGFMVADFGGSGSGGSH